MPTRKIHSDDYHDFVFKNGRLLGEFEQMYRKSKEVPWHQDKDSDKLDYKITLDIASTAAPFNEISDIGCGLGYFLNGSKVLGTNGHRLLGYDVSITAIRKAKELFPNLDFECIDFIETHEIFTTKIDRRESREREREEINYC